jgi:hypothetical protein
MVTLSSVELAGGALAADAAEPRSFWLSPLVYVCHLQDGSVILDLLRNKYLGVGKRERRLLTRVVQGWPQLPVAEREKAAEVIDTDEALRVAGELKSVGILNRETNEALRVDSLCVSVEGDIYSLADEVDLPIGATATDMVDFVAAYVRARMGLRRRDFYRTVMEVQAAKRAVQATRDSPTLAELGKAIGVFRSIRPFVFEAKGQCLLHALSLMRFLLRRGLPTNWVFAVRTNPWGAHTWIQYENLILDSNPERVCEFTPILAI